MDLTRGPQRFDFDYSKLRAGVYFVKLENGYEKFIAGWSSNDGGHHWT
ncbi:MAG: hypothetical protein IPN76_30965 [Saprospiraceae bacterium]|nr:hypothetical protein [Saprospiraceae bacterium]